MINRFNKHNPAKEVKPAFPWTVGMSVARMDRRTNELQRYGVNGVVKKITATQVVVMFGNVEERYNLHGRKVVGGTSNSALLVVPTQEQLEELQTRIAKSNAASQELEAEREKRAAMLAPIAEKFSPALITANDTTWELQLFVPKNEIENVIAALAKI